MTSTKRSVRYFDVAVMHRPIRDALRSAMTDVLDSGWYITGEHLKRFETAYAYYCGVSHCVGTSNGLDALRIALSSLGVKTGDEVIVPSNTYIACWLAVTQLGAIPVPVEPRIETYNLDPDRIQAAVTDRTKAIMAVHLYGQPCEMDAIQAVAGQHDIPVVEDNAQAQGATYGGRRTGAFGAINACSFYPAKNLGALGDAGCLTTMDDALAQGARTLGNYGSEKKYYNLHLGYNARLDEMQAALLAVKLPFLDEWNSTRQAIAKRYTQELHGIGDIILPETAADAEHVYHIFMIRTAYRDALQQHLRECGVQTLIHYPVPPHLQQAYAFMTYSRGDFPIAETIADTCLSLPIYPGLPEADISYTCEGIRSFFERL